MFQGNIPISFLGECILGVVYLINRTPLTVLHNKTPFEILCENVPSIDHLRVFDSLCFTHNQLSKGDKFAPRSRRCVFVGYSNNQKGWKLYDLDTGEYFVTRDVQFHENEFPFASKTYSSTSDDLGPFSQCEVSSFVFDDLEETAACGDTVETLSNNLPVIDLHVNDHVVNVATPTSPVLATPTFEPLDSAYLNNPTTHHQSATTNISLPHDESHRGCGHRVKYPSVWLQDYVAHIMLTTSPPTCSSSFTRSSGAPYPIAHFVNCNNFSAIHRNLLAAITVDQEPRSFHEAMTDSGWREAMQKEICALEANKTWVMEPLPLGNKAPRCKWIYKLKYANGSIERLKARLVLLGNHQVEGNDYNETFAPVAKMVTV